MSDEALLKVAELLDALISSYDSPRTSVNEAIQQVYSDLSKVIRDAAASTYTNQVDKIDALVKTAVTKEIERFTGTGSVTVSKPKPKVRSQK